MLDEDAGCGRRRPEEDRVHGQVDVRGGRGRSGAGPRPPAPARDPVITEQDHHHRRARPPGQAARRGGGQPAARSPRGCSSRPAVILFILFLSSPSATPSTCASCSSRSQGGAFGNTHAGLRRVRQLRRLAHRPGVRRLARPTRRIFGIIAVPLTLGLALCSSPCCSTSRACERRGSPAPRSSCPTPSPASSRRSCGDSCTCRPTSPFNFVLTRLGLPAPDFLGAPEIYGSLANIAIWAGVGFNMIIMYTALRSIPAELYEAAKHRWRERVADRLADQDPAAAAGSRLTLLFSLIAHPSGLRGADDTAHAVELDLVLVLPADEDLPRRVRARQRLGRRRGIRRPRARHPRHLRLACCAAAATNLRRSRRPS